MCGRHHERSVRVGIERESDGKNVEMVNKNEKLKFNNLDFETDSTGV